jgi:hypothetical protein
LALAREIAAQEPSIDSWFERLLEEPGLCDVSGRDLEIPAGRLKDVCEALVEGIRLKRSRLNVTPKSGQLLAKLIRMMVSLGPQQKRPKGTDLAATAAIELLDEILAVRLTIKPDLYDLVQVVHRWWAPRSFPDIVSASIEPIIDKLTAGLVFRARGGQRSEVLLQRLKQAINSEELYKGRIREIVENETGLLGEIQDWIRGMERGTSRQRSSSALSAVGAESFVQQLAELFRLTLDGRESANNDPLQRAVRSVASLHGLAAVGNAGDIVEYSPKHRAIFLRSDR